MALGMAMSVCQSVHQFGAIWNIFTTSGWITLTNGSDVPLKMKCKNFGDPFSSSILRRSILNLSNRLVIVTINKYLQTASYQP